MSDDTLRTKAIKSWLANWQKWTPLAGGVALSVLSLAVAYGGKKEHSANMEANYARDQQETHEKLTQIEAKLDRLVTLPAQVEDLNGRMSRMESNWDTAYEQAGKGIQSHRARQ